MPPYIAPPHSDMFAWNAHLLQPMTVWDANGGVARMHSLPSLME